MLLEAELAQAAEATAKFLKDNVGRLPEVWNPQKPGKITRGENLAGLPYLVVDMPSWYSKEDILAVRTLLWWGNGIYHSLQVSGKALIPVSATAFGKINGDWLTVTGNDPWSYEAEQLKMLKEHYPSPESLNQRIQAAGFLKIVIRRPFSAIHKCSEEIQKLAGWLLDYQS